MPKNVLVVGMPRSGTSMTAAIFANNGYFIAEDTNKELRAGDEFNPTGYWEADALIKANSEIFNAAGFKHDNTWLYDSISTKQASQILTLKPTASHQELVNKSDRHCPWIWKDPRLCYTLGYWWPLLNPKTTGVLFLKRDPEEIYSSFLRLKWRTHSKKNKEDVLTRIQNHLEATEIALKKYNIPHVVIQYADYKNNPDETTEKLNAFFNLKLSLNDLGYNHKYNNHSFQGMVLRITNMVGDILPGNIRNMLKKLIPKFIWKIINPHRYKNN